MKHARIASVFGVPSELASIQIWVAALGFAAKVLHKQSVWPHETTGPVCQVLKMKDLGDTILTILHKSNQENQSERFNLLHWELGARYPLFFKLLVQLLLFKGNCVYCVENVWKMSRHEIHPNFANRVCEQVLNLCVA